MFRRGLEFPLQPHACNCCAHRRWDVFCDLRCGQLVHIHAQEAQGGQRERAEVLPDFSVLRVPRGLELRYRCLQTRDPLSIVTRRLTFGSVLDVQLRRFRRWLCRRPDIAEVGLLDRLPLIEARVVCRFGLFWSFCVPNWRAMFHVGLSLAPSKGAGRYRKPQKRACQEQASEFLVSPSVLRFL